MKVLGIDYGEKRIGIAISDETGQFARGLCTLTRKNLSSDFQFIKDIIFRERVEGIVIGLPVQFDGTEGIQCEKVRKFAARLEKTFQIPIFFIDEVLSSIEAKEVMSLRPRHRFSKEDTDRIAAAIILQRYLDKLNGV